MHGTLDVLKADPYLGVEEILCAKTCPFSVIFYCALCQSKIQNGTCKNLASIAGVRKDLCNRCGYRGLILVEAGGVEPPSENTSTKTSPGADGYPGSLALPVPLPPGKPSRLEVR